jgi:glycosyltransferase involved in cell wall biosynthesis
MPARILHVLGTASLEGASIPGMVRTLAANVDPSEFRIDACFLGASGPWTGRLRDAGIDAFEVPWRTPRELAGALRFWRFLRSRPVDLLHVHYGGRAVRRLARSATGARLLMHLHGRIRSEDDYRPVPLRLDDADAVVATSRAVAAVVQAKQLRVVYPGVSLPEVSQAQDPWLIGAAGRLLPIKGYDHLLDAFAAVAARDDRARLQIAGDGPSRHGLQQQARALGIEDKVSFPGWSDDLPALMQRWSVFVQPSLEEALGITVLQAMASGLPVIASDVGGLPEAVVDGETGLLVPPRDVGALSATLARLLADPLERRLLGEAARVRARRFSEVRFVTEVCEVYRELLGDRR